MQSTKAGRAPRPLTRRQEAAVSRAIEQVTPTPSWYWVCRSAFASGLARPTVSDPIGELAMRGIFPPGPGRISSAAVLTPMCACESRACTSRVCGAERHKLYPFYALAGQMVSTSDVEVFGVNDCGQSVRTVVRGRDRREVFTAARTAGVHPTRLQVLRRGRRRRLCDDCRLSLQEAMAARDRANERRSAAAAGETPDLDAQGKPIEPEAPLNPAQAAMERIRFYGEGPEEAKLPPEDEASLQAEIGRYLAAAGGTPMMLVVKC